MLCCNVGSDVELSGELDIEDRIDEVESWDLRVKECEGPGDDVYKSHFVNIPIVRS